jgi:hypothetical protein
MSEPELSNKSPTPCVESAPLRAHGRMATTACGVQAHLAEGMGVRVLVFLTVFLPVLRLGEQGGLHPKPYFDSSQNIVKLATIHEP